MKGDRLQVTDVDQRCESVIVDRLRGQFPEHKFIGEEDSAAQGATAALTDDPTWMIDPVDGTTNFVHKVPFVCVCIGLAVKREVCACSVHALCLLLTTLRALQQGSAESPNPATSGFVDVWMPWLESRGGRLVRAWVAQRAFHVSAMRQGY